MSPADRRCSANTIEPATTSSLASFLLLLQRDQSSRIRGLPWGLNAYLLKARSILASPTTTTTSLPIYHFLDPQLLHLDFLSLDRVAGEEVVGSWDKEGVLFCFLNFLGFFCLVFVISSIPERDKQHFQGEKKNHVIRKQRRVRASHFHVSLFPTAPAHLVFLLFPHGLHSVFSFWFVFSHSAFLLCPSCLISNWPHLPFLCGK